MAGDWIKMRADLQTHPKVVRISSALKADRLRTIGGLHAVWCLFDAHSVDGSLEGYTLEALDSLVGWPGFAGAMAAVGWLEVSEGYLALPRFADHNGQSAKRRAQETERKRVERMAMVDPQDVRTLSASHADKKRTREEKRREEVSTPSLRSGVERATRLPHDWSLPLDWAAWAKDERPDLDPQAVAAGFADYWHGKAGKDGRKVDWQATWRNWVRNQRQAPRSRPPPESFREKDTRQAAERVRQATGGLLSDRNTIETIECHSPPLGLIASSQS